jgi:hypothetical protein
MRLVKIKADAEHAESIRNAAYAAGISRVSMHTVEESSAEGQNAQKNVFDIARSTPKSRKFIEKLLGSSFYDPNKIELVVRPPRSIIGSESARELTEPLEEPATDLYEELWQFSHITYGLVLRVFIAACLLSYGLIGQKLLLMAAGLLFLPLLPMLLAIAFGAAGRQWRLAVQGLAALMVSIAVVFLGGIVTALVSEGPMKFDDLNPLSVGLVLSTAVGIAAGLASIDDAGRRELIGLAAASQVGITPAWLGVTFIFGPSPTADVGKVMTQVFSLFANAAVIVVTAMIVQTATGVAKNIRLVKT